MSLIQTFQYQRIGYWQAVLSFCERFAAIDDACKFFRPMFRTSRSTKTIRQLEAAITKREQDHLETISLAEKRYARVFLQNGLAPKFVDPLAKLVACYSTELDAAEALKHGRSAMKTVVQMSKERR